MKQIKQKLTSEDVPKNCKREQKQSGILFIFLLKTNGTN